MKDNDSVKERFFDQPGMLAIAPSAIGQSYPPSPYSTAGRLLAAERKAKKEDAAQPHPQAQVVASSREFLATRPDLAPALVKHLETKPLAAVRAVVSMMTKPEAPRGLAPSRPQARQPAPVASASTPKPSKPRGPSEAERREAARLETRLRELEASTSARMRDLEKQARARDQTTQQEQARAARVQAAQRERDLAKLDRAMGIEPAGGVRMEGFTQVFAMEHKPPHIRRDPLTVFGMLGAAADRAEQDERTEEARKARRSNDETNGAGAESLVFDVFGTGAPRRTTTRGAT